MSRIEIHQHEENIWLDVVLPDNEASLEKLRMLDVLVEAIGVVGLEALYPDCGPVTLQITVGPRGGGYSVLAEDGTEIDSGDARGGLPALADRIQNALTDDLFIVNP